MRIFSGDLNSITAKCSSTWCGPARQNQFLAGRRPRSPDHDVLHVNRRLPLQVRKMGGVDHRQPLQCRDPQLAVVGGDQIGLASAALIRLEPVVAVDMSKVRRTVPLLLPALQAIGRGPRDHVSAEPQILAGPQHPVHTGARVCKRTFTMSDGSPSSLVKTLRI